MTIKIVSPIKNAPEGTKAISEVIDRTKNVQGEAQQLARDAVVVTVVRSPQQGLAKSVRSDSFDKMQRLSEDVAQDIRDTGEPSLLAHDGITESSTATPRAK